MATCSDIVRLAMGRLRQIRAGEQPTGFEAADGMLALQGLYDQWAADGLFGRVNDTIPSGNYTAQEQDRVVNDGGYTITLPQTITPQLPTGTYYPIWPDERIWAALQTNTPRPPLDLAMIEVVQGGAMSRYLYDAPTRTWLALNALTLTGSAPLASRGIIGLSSCLAEFIADNFGAQVAPATSRLSVMFRWGLSSRYENQRVGGMSDYF